MTNPPTQKNPLDGETLTVTRIHHVPKGEGSRNEYRATTEFDGKPSIDVTMFEEHMDLLRLVSSEDLPAHDAYLLITLKTPIDVVVELKDNKFRITGAYNSDDSLVKLEDAKTRTQQPATVPSRGSDMVAGVLHRAALKQLAEANERAEGLAEARLDLHVQVVQLQSENRALKAQVGSVDVSAYELGRKHQTEYIEQLERRVMDLQTELAKKGDSDE